MFTLRCTARLTKRLRVSLDATAASDTLLGDWYANLIHVGRQQLVLAASERTLLPVVVGAAPIATLAARLREGLADLLVSLGIPPHSVEREIEAMREVAYGRTTNRQVLGVLVDFAKAVPYYLEKGQTLRTVTRQLAHTPCGPLHNSTSFPDLEAAALFRASLH